MIIGYRVVQIILACRLYFDWEYTGIFYLWETLHKICENTGCHGHACSDIGTKSHSDL